MSYLYKIFIKGLLTVLPLSLTFYIVFWFVSSVELALSSFFKSIFPIDFYFPGLGIIASIVLVMLVGLLLNNYLTGKFFRYVEEQLLKIPFVKTIYGPLKDLMGLFTSNSNQNMKKVVLVDYPHLNATLLGLVTRETFSDLPEGSLDDDIISVYIPCSYLMGGLTVLVPKSQVRELDIPVDKAMKLAITGWIHLDKAINVK